MSYKRLAVVFVSLLLVVAACGGKSAEEELLEQIIESGGDDISDIDISSDDGEFNLSIEGEDGEDVSISGSGDDDDFEITVEGEDGETMTFGGGEVPEGLDLPVAPGGDVQTSMTSNDEAFVSLEYPNGNFDQLVAFYDDALNAGSDEVEKSETSFTTEDGTFRNVFYNPDGGDWAVTVGDCIGLGDGSICVTLMQYSE